MFRGMERSRLGRAAALALALAVAAAVPAGPVGAASSGEETAAPRAAPARPAASKRPPRPEPEEIRPGFEEHLPEPLLREGPRGLLWWQWLGLPVVAVLAIAAGAVLGKLTRLILGRLAARTPTRWDDLLIERVASPLTALWAVMVATALAPWLALPAGPDGAVERVLRALAYLALFWAGFRAIDVGEAAARQASWTRANAALAGLLPLGRRIAKAAILALGMVAVLSELGFQVASLIAGLGVGGIAVALGAQRTFADLFGSVAIGVDQPFRVGDFVNVEGTTGTIEIIGIRSTRIRTLDRTVVTIPNGKLADMRAENFAARDRIRLYANLNVDYGTTAAQLRGILAGIEASLRAHPKIVADDVSVRFTALQDAGLNVEIVAFFLTTDWGEFTAIRQEMLLGAMEIVERAGSRLSFPRRIVRIVGEERRKGEGPASPPGPRSGGADRDRTDDL
jgi:MscS family membrane protein